MSNYELFVDADNEYVIIDSYIFENDIDLIDGNIWGFSESDEMLAIEYRQESLLNYRSWDRNRNDLDAIIFDYFKLEENVATRIPLSDEDVEFIQTLKKINNL